MLFWFSHPCRQGSRPTPSECCAGPRRYLIPLQCLPSPQLSFPQRANAPGPRLKGFPEGLPESCPPAGLWDMELAIAEAPNRSPPSMLILHPQGPRSLETQKRSPVSQGNFVLKTGRLQEAKSKQPCFHQHICPPEETKSDSWPPSCGAYPPPPPTQPGHAPKPLGLLSLPWALAREPQTGQAEQAAQGEVMPRSKHFSI